MVCFYLLYFLTHQFKKTVSLAGAIIPQLKPLPSRFSFVSSTPGGVTSPVDHKKNETGELSLLYMFVPTDCKLYCIIRRKTRKPQRKSAIGFLYLGLLEHLGNYSVYDLQISLHHHHR